jgi:hypothetical protein
MNLRFYLERKMSQKLNRYRIDKIEIPLEYTIIMLPLRKAELNGEKLFLLSL